MTNTLRRFADNGLAIPSTTAWYLSDLDEFHGNGVSCGDDLLHNRSASQ